MQKKRAVIEVTIEYPAKQNPLDYIEFKGGALVNVTTKIIKEETIGDVDTPWGQKMREFYAVKKLIADGVRAGIGDYKNHCNVTVYGGTWGGFSYSLSIDPKKDKSVPKQLQERLRLDINLDKGHLTWTRRYGTNSDALAKMTVGNPNVSEEIAKFVSDWIK